MKSDFIGYAINYVVLMLLVIATLCILDKENPIKAFSISFFTSFNPEIVHKVQKELIESRAHMIIDDVHEKYPIKPELLDAITMHGAHTDNMLYNLFMKCITPGSTIVVGGVGGSISVGYKVGESNAYIHQYAQQLQLLCPDASVKVNNAAQRGTGSLMAGLCTDSLLEHELDVLLVEFSLNDGAMYNVTGTVDSRPYELLIHYRLSNAFCSPPVVFSLFFWGMTFHYDNAQIEHSKVTQHYGITSFSIRDLIWDYIQNKRLPWDKKANILADNTHHPNLSVHNMTGSLIGQYTAKRFLELAQSGKASPLSRGACNDAPKQAEIEFYSSLGTISKPLNPWLNRFHFSKESSFVCESDSAPSTRPLKIFNMTDWEPVVVTATTVYRDSQVCYEPVHSKASALWTTRTYQGFVMICTCRKGPGLRNDPPSFNLQVDVSGLEGKHIWQDVQLKPFIEGIGECYTVDPPLPHPNTYTFNILPGNQCISAWKKENINKSVPKKGVPCPSTGDGFQALITL